MKDWIFYYLNGLLDYCRAKVVGAILSVFLFAFGGFNDAVYVFLIFMLIDTIFGFVLALCKKKVSSDKLRRGVIKFIIYFVFIILANCLDKVVPSPFGTSLRNFVLTYLVLTEAISILEHLSVCGLEIPRLESFIRWWRSR